MHERIRPHTVMERVCLLKEWGLGRSVCVQKGWEESRRHYGYQAGPDNGCGLTQPSFPTFFFPFYVARLSFS